MVFMLRSSVVILLPLVAAAHYRKPPCSDDEAEVKVHDSHGVAGGVVCSVRCDPPQPGTCPTDVPMCGSTPCPMTCSTTYTPHSRGGTCVVMCDDTGPDACPVGMTCLTRDSSRTTGPCVWATQHSDVTGVDVPTKEIARGVHMPVISIGDGGQETKQGKSITATWLSLGGRGIDTANDYGNQPDVRQAINESGVKREDLFITTKIPGCDDAESYIKEDLQQLGVDFIDLLLIHFPQGDCAKGWATLEKYHEQGVLKAIGVSHFERKHITSLLKTAKVVPHVNQIQLNVLAHDDDQISASVEQGIIVEAYSPLGRSGKSGDIPGNVHIQKIAAAHNVSTYQVAVKWILQKGHLLTFQSSKATHQVSDADVFGFQLDVSEMKELDGLQGQGSVIV